MEFDEEREWTKGDVLALVEEYKHCPELWSPTDPNYLNKPVRIEAWSRIARKLSWPKLECKQKIFDLLTTYRRIKTMEKRLEAAGEKLQRPWFAYEALKFLEKRDASKVYDGSLKISTMDSAGMHNVKIEPTNTLTNEREVLTDILKTYKALRCLWDPKLMAYRNPYERAKAYNILLQKWRKIDPGCSLDTVKNRLTNYRTTYSKQKRKVELSIMNGDEEIYTPTLWYFDLLQFIDEVDRCKSERSKFNWKELADENSIKGTPLEREYWTDLLQTYGTFRCLWDSNDSRYVDHEERNEKYNILLGKLQKIDPEATMEGLKKKLCNCRTAYRKERAKIEASRKRGDTNIYAPTLWYFDIMSFLDEKDEHTNDEHTSKVTPTERKIITDVLETYRKFRLLWDRKNQHFSDKYKRNQATDVLLKKWRKLHPESTKDSMLIKLASLRAVYRRERKKMERSKKMGDVIIYEPTLWYFPLMRFLDEKDRLIPSTACDEVKECSELNECSNLNESNDDDMLLDGEEPDAIGSNLSVLSNEDIGEDQLIEYQLNEPQDSFASVPPKRRKRKLNDDTEYIANALGILQSTVKRLHTGNEPREIRTFCSYIASKLCSYSASTQKGVQHAIYDILMKADRAISKQSTQHNSNSRNIKKQKQFRPRITFARALTASEDNEYTADELSSASGSENENIHEDESTWCSE